MKINKWVIGGVAFVVGGGIGVGVTYLIMKKRHKYEKDHYCDDCDASKYMNLIERVSEAYPQLDVIKELEDGIKRASDWPNDHEEQPVAASETTHVITQNDRSFNPATSVNRYSSAVEYDSRPVVPYISPEEDRAYMEFMAAKKRERAERMKKKFTRYDKIDKDFEDGRNIDDLKEVDEVQLKINNDQPEKPIHIITPEQFANECYGYSKNTLQWWKRNNLMTTEDYEIVDVPDLIGTEWVDRIGEFEPNVVYIRNDMSDSDYEIIATEENYYDFRN